MAWSKNGTPDTLTSTSDTVTISDLTATKFNVFLSHRITSGESNQQYRLNNDSGSNYAVRQSFNGGADGTGTSGTESGSHNPDDTYDGFTVIYLFNSSSEEKLVTMFNVNQQASGAGNAPTRQEGVWKWANTSDDVTRIDMVNTSTGDYNTDSNLSALNGDTAEENVLPTNLQDGTRFEATDTRKIYYGIIPSVTFENLFSTDNMTHNTSQTAIESGYFRVNHRVGNGADDHAYWDLGTILSDNWFMRCKFSCTAKSSSATNPNTAGLFSLSASNDNDFSVNGLGFKVSIGGGGNYDNLFFSGGTSNQSGGEGYSFSGISDFDNINNAGTTKYVEIIKNGTSITMNVYDDEYVTLYDTVTTTYTGTMTGLRYFTYKNRDDINGSHTETIHIDDLRIYNGVTSTDFTWIEET